MKAALGLAACLAASLPALADNAAEVMELGRMEVVGTTPKRYAWP